MDKDKVIIYLDRYNDLLEKEKTLVLSDYTKLNKKIEGLEAELKEVRAFRDLGYVEICFESDPRYIPTSIAYSPFKINVLKLLNHNIKTLFKDSDQMVSNLVNHLNREIVEFVQSKTIDLRELQDSLWAQQADLDKMKKEYFEEKIKSSSFLEKIKLLF